MNKKDLINAFGEIDGEAFDPDKEQKLPNVLTAESEDIVRPEIVENKKSKINKNPIFYGAMAVACIAIFAIGIPILMNNSQIPAETEITTDAFSEGNIITTPETITTETESQPAETTEITKTTEPEKTTEITEAEKTEQEDPNPSNDIFEVREFPDDKIVPAEWIPVYSFAEAAKNFDEIVSADVSNMDTADAIIALANKNVIFVDSFLSHFWDADTDHPYYSENYTNPYASENPYYSDKPLYPILLSSEYYTDIQEIYDLGSETYINDALNNEMNGFYYDRGKLRKPFMKENGISYVDFWVLPIWNFTPFRCRTYIEIVSETENKCSFIWHRPDWEMLNEPEEGYEFFYYSCDGEAVYENGSWKLSKVYVEGYSLL